MTRSELYIKDKKYRITIYRSKYSTLIIICKKTTKDDDKPAFYGICTQCYIINGFSKHFTEYRIRKAIQRRIKKWEKEDAKK